MVSQLESTFLTVSNSPITFFQFAIILPSDDEIRQNEGFKNVSLGNVLSAAYSDKRVSFVSHEDHVCNFKLVCLLIAGVIYIMMVMITGVVCEFTWSSI